MRIWFLSVALVAACGGASSSPLFGGSDGGTTTSDATPGSAPTDTAGGLDASPPTAPPDTGTGGGHATTPMPASDAGADTGDGSPPPTSGDTCPETPDYSYEFSNVAIDAPLCGAMHGRACADPAKDCCYYDGVSNAYVCLHWLDGG